MTGSAEEHTRPANRWRAGLVIGVLSALVAASSTFAAVTFLNRTPDTGSPEAGFARDMQVHHAQAVELSTIVRDRTQDPTVRSIAYDIITSQQQQIGQMYGWLEMWNLPQASPGKRMAWMGSMDHSTMSGPGSMAMLGPDGRMPGMASSAQIERLRGLRGVPAERLFLQLMIEHHIGGVAMARAAGDLSSEPEVDQLAGAIVIGQQAEVAAMRQMLAERDDA